MIYTTDAPLIVRLTRHGAVLAVDVLSDVDGSWNVRKSFELEKRVAALAPDFLAIKERCMHLLTIDPVTSVEQAA